MPLTTKRIPKSAPNDPLPHLAAGGSQRAPFRPSALAPLLAARAPGAPGSPAAVPEQRAVRSTAAAPSPAALEDARGVLEELGWVAREKDQVPVVLQEARAKGNPLYCCILQGECLIDRLLVFYSIYFSSVEQSRFIGHVYVSNPNHGLYCIA